MLGNDQETETNRGQVGIGTLIVFIAMVLVAAIAAGVLINTAGFLQTQAEDTGTESTEQVADNLNVITEVGEVGDGDATAGTDQIGEIRIGVQPAAGASDINLAELTLQYVSDGEFANLVVGVKDSADTDTQATGDTSPDNIYISNDNVGNEDEYGIEVITAENPGDVVMTDGSDRYELVIPLTADADYSSIDTGPTNPSTVPNLSPLDEGEQVEVTITTEVGAQTVAFLQVPDSLSGDAGGSTVNL